jgi:hypothetical protein
MTPWLYSPSAAGSASGTLWSTDGLLLSGSLDRLRERDPLFSLRSNLGCSADFGRSVEGSSSWVTLSCFVLLTLSDRFSLLAERFLLRDRDFFFFPPLRLRDRSFFFSPLRERRERFADRLRDFRSRFLDRLLEDLRRDFLSLSRLLDLLLPTDLLRDRAAFESFVSASSSPLVVCTSVSGSFLTKSALVFATSLSLSTIWLLFDLLLDFRSVSSFSFSALPDFPRDLDLESLRSLDLLRDLLAERSRFFLLESFLGFFLREPLFERLRDPDLLFERLPDRLEELLDFRLDLERDRVSAMDSSIFRPCMS